MANSAQSNVSYSNEIFKQYLMQLSSGIIWKNATRAKENEPTDVVDLYLSELFVVANRGLLNFDIVKSFPRVVLQNIPEISEIDVEKYATDKRLIPLDLRDRVVQEYAGVFTGRDPLYGRPAYKINEDQYEIIYEEPNNYYRMLNGLPNVGDTDYVYNTDRRWDTTTPVHLLPYADRLQLESAGIVDELLEKYPSKEYLRHIGKKCIDPFNARIADRFEILYKNEVSSDVLNEDFTEVYNSSRQLVLSVYYNISFQKINSLYDSFLAMSILFMTLQTMQCRYLQVDVTRDFYDLESLKLIYDSYGVPFYNEIPLDYHRKIVKNINKLISYKGSSQVFMDLFDIFDIGSIDIYSYFLKKTHLFDSEGNPIFNIKKDLDGNDMYDETGNPILDPSSFEIKFSKVKIYDDPALSISDSINDVDYSFITENDPYWIEDQELADKLASEDFNYLESKYIGVQMVFDLMKITCENAHIFRMIADNKEIIEQLEFRWTDIGLTCSVYDAFIYLATLYCRHFGYEGVINTKLPAVMNTLGYNFHQSIAQVRSSLISNEYLVKNEKLMILLSEVSITNLDSLTTTYDAIMEIQDVLIDGYTNAKSVEEFNAYRELYNSLMTSKELESVYTNPLTGKLYETFADVLSGSSPELMQRYLLLNDSDISGEIELVTSQLQVVIPSLKFLSLSAGMGSSAMIDSLFRILNFFKSAKAELVGSNISYMISMRGINFLKLLDKLILYTTSVSRISDNQIFCDLVKLVKLSLQHKSDTIRLLDEYDNSATQIYLKDYINQLTGEIVSITQIIDTIFSTESWYIDFLHEITAATKLTSTMTLSDIANPELIHLEILEYRHIGKFRDNIVRLTDLVKTDPNLPIFYYCMEVLNYVEEIRSLTHDVSTIKESDSHKDVLSVFEAPYAVDDKVASIKLSDYIGDLDTPMYYTDDASRTHDIYVQMPDITMTSERIDSSDRIHPILNDVVDYLKDGAFELVDRDVLYTQLSSSADIRLLSDVIREISGFESTRTDVSTVGMDRFIEKSYLVSIPKSDGDNYSDGLFEYTSEGKCVAVN